MKNNSKQTRVRTSGKTKSATESIELASNMAELHKAVVEDRILGLRERMFFLIDTTAPQHRKYKWLEENTGVPASRWHNLFNKKQLPTLEMLMAIAKNNSEYAYWLLLGGYNPEKQKVPDEDKLSAYRIHREWVTGQKSGE